MEKGPARAGPIADHSGKQKCRPKPLRKNALCGGRHEVVSEAFVVAPSIRPISLTLFLQAKLIDRTQWERYEDGNARCRSRRS
jgi:hypothetical protein